MSDELNATDLGDQDADEPVSNPDINDVFEGLTEEDFNANLGDESDGDEKEAEESGEDQSQGETDSSEGDSGVLSLEELASKELSWEEISKLRQQGKIPKEYLGVLKSMEKAHFQSVEKAANERKEAQRLQRQFEELKKQIEQEPPYVKAMREEREQAAERERLANMDPDERKDYESRKHVEALQREIQTYKDRLEQNELARFRLQATTDIKVGLLAEGLPVKHFDEVYQIFLSNGSTVEGYTIDNAIEDFKEQMSKKPATVDVEAIKKQALEEARAEILAKLQKKKATGIKSSSGSTSGSTSESKVKKPVSVQDIWGEDIFNL